MTEPMEINAVTDMGIVALRFITKDTLEILIQHDEDWTSRICQITQLLPNDWRVNIPNLSDIEVLKDVSRYAPAVVKWIEDNPNVLKEAKKYFWRERLNELSSEYEKWQEKAQLAKQESHYCQQRADKANDEYEEVLKEAPKGAM